MTTRLLRLHPDSRSLASAAASARRIARRFGRGTASLVVALALLACSPSAPTEQNAHGTLVEVDAAKHTVTLDHGEIPGVMQAMTMSFAVAPEVDLSSLEAGAEVDFRVRAEGSTVTVIELHPTAKP